MMTIILRIALPTPLRQLFDYLPPIDSSLKNFKAGQRVRVPLQNRTMIGILVEVAQNSEFPLNKLKRAYEVIDQEPVISNDIWDLCCWAADYYHYSLGEVLIGALPLFLRQGKNPQSTQEEYWYLTATGESISIEQLKRAPKQVELLKLFHLHQEGLTLKELKRYGFNKSLLNIFKKKNWVESSFRKNALSHESVCSKPLVLNAEQCNAVSAIKEAQGFQIFLLDGVTGSGKTEVYLQAISEFLQKQKQVLILVPEIGLTPQTVQRFRERFTVPVVALHSSLSEKEKLNTWVAAKSGEAKIIIGTRSAIFIPMENLGLIVVDEEHDASFKQQESFRYHARDLAVMRAHMNKIPIVLGSATPSLETLHNARQGRYQHLRLSERAGLAALPEMKILDICKAQLEQGLSPALLSEIKTHLQQDAQVMLFLNRRGYAPVLMCHGCGWTVMCKRCDSRMTYHQSPERLHCHHCDAQRKLIKQCENCKEPALLPIGLGTEKLEDVLTKHFPNVSIARIDRDSTQRKGSLETLLNKINNNEHRILIGTQMLAKGHHFPNVTLVGIIDADGGFFSSDFRALERMGQLILQVSGRAGRAEKPGKVIIQTHHPDHPLLHRLLSESYYSFATTLLKEREEAKLPPHFFFALFRAEAYALPHATFFLQQIKNLVDVSGGNIKILGPIPAPMPRKAGRHRVQLLIQAQRRPLLQNFLRTLLPDVEKIPSKHRVNWSLDVDPLDMF